MPTAPFPAASDMAYTTPAGRPRKGSQASRSRRNHIPHALALKPAESYAPHTAGADGHGWHNAHSKSIGNRLASPHEAGSTRFPECRVAHVLATCLPRDS